MNRMAAAGTIAPPIAASYPLSEAAQALRDLEGHGTAGKTVLDVAGGN